MPKTNYQEERDQEEPRVARAIIYMRETSRPGSRESQFELSIDRQYAHCRRKAIVLQADIIGQFVDREWLDEPGCRLREMLDLAEKERPDYLIATELARLTYDCDEAFDIMLRLGSTGTAVAITDQDDSLSR